MRARRRTVPSVLTVLALAGAGLLTPLPAHAADSSLSGTVTGPDGSPLADICVDAVSLDSGDFGGGADGQPFADTTDAAGAWSIDGLPEGEYVVAFNTCEARTTAYASEYFQEVASISEAEMIQLTGTSSRSGVDATLELSGEIAGVVTDDVTGEGLEGICVRAFGRSSDSFGDTRTDASGAYTVSGLTPGEHELAFSECSAPYTYQDELYDDVKLGPTGSSETPQAVTVTSGETATADAALTEGGAVTGTVTAAHTGRPQLLVCIGLHPADDPTSEAVTGTVSGFEPDADAPSTDGRYVVPGVTPGTYTVAFADPVCGDEGYATSWYDGEQTQEGATVVTVTQGGTLEGISGVVTPLPSTGFICSSEEPGDAETFPDVPSDNVHRSAITCMSRYGVLRGRPDGTYGPAEPVRRGQLATLVAGLLDTAGVPLPADPPDAFDDDAGHPHETAIDQLAELGLLGGTGARRFSPDGTVDRGQVATVMVAAYQQITGFALLRPESGFEDDGNSVHEANIERSALAGFTAGTSATRFEPFGLVRRDALATFLARVLDRTSRDTLFEVAHGGEQTEAQDTATPAAAVTATASLERYRMLGARR